MEALSQKEIFDWLVKKLDKGELEELSAYKDQFKDSTKEEMDMFIKAYREVEDLIRERAEDAFDHKYNTDWENENIFHANEASFIVTDSGYIDIASKIKSLGGVYLIVNDTNDEDEDIIAIIRVTNKAELIAELD